MKGLTKKQNEVLGFIQEFIHAHRYSPSYREIMQRFSFSSLGSVYKHVYALKRKGFLTAEKQRSRSMMLSEALAKSKNNGTELPFIGYIRAGFPIETFSKAQTIAVPDFFIHVPEQTYVLKAKGDSLSEELICDGDYIVVEARQVAAQGETVIALINHHDTIIKKYYSEGQYVRLAGLHPQHQPIVLRDEDVLIQGAVVGLLRQY